MKKIKNIILDNFHLKILSLLVAFLLWLNITSTQKTRLEFYADIKILNKPKFLKIEKVEPDKVLIVIEGIRTKLNQVNFSKIKVFVDGRKLHKGKNTLKVIVRTSDSEYFNIVQVKPEKINVYANPK